MRKRKEQHFISCIEAQGMITRFIENQLNVEELQHFLYHMNHCKECREELEVYFILLTGMKQLDEKQNLSVDFHMELENLIHKGEERIIKEKVNYIRKNIVLFTIILLTGLFCGLEIGEYVEQTEQLAAKSNFRLTYYFFRDRHETLDTIIEQNYYRIIAYQFGKEEEKEEQEETKPKTKKQKKKKTKPKTAKQETNIQEES